MQILSAAKMDGELPPIGGIDQVTCSREAVLVLEAVPDRPQFVQAGCRIKS